MRASSGSQAVYVEAMPVHGSGPFQAKRGYTPDPHTMLLMPVERAFLAATICACLGCSHQPDMGRAELFPETQQPHFKTCAARLGGTYKERELQRSTWWWTFIKNRLLIRDRSLTNASPESNNPVSEPTVLLKYVTHRHPPSS